VATRVSPSTGSGTIESTWRTKPSAPTCAVAEKCPGSSNEIATLPSARRCALAPLRCAIFSTPWGVIQS